MGTANTRPAFNPNQYIGRDGADETDVLQIREAFDALDEKKLGRIPISKLTKLGYANPEELFIRDPDNEKSSLLINREYQKGDWGSERVDPFGKIAKKGDIQLEGKTGVEPKGCLRLSCPMPNNAESEELIDFEQFFGVMYRQMAQEREMRPDVVFESSVSHVTCLLCPFVAKTHGATTQIVK